MDNQRGAAQQPPHQAPTRPLDAILQRAAPLTTAIWLLLIILPLANLAEAHPAPPRLLATLLVAACLAALYLRLTLHRPFAGPPLARRELRWRLFLLGLLAALALAIGPLSGSSMPPWWLVYVTIAAGRALPTGSAAWVVLLVSLLASVIGWVLGGLGHLLPLLGLGVVGFGAIAVNRLIVTNTELRAAREEIARLAVAEERLRFARDLHDLVGHNLSLIALKSELAGRLVRAVPDRAVAEIGDAERVARQALDEVREAVAGYRQPTLDDELDGARELLAAAGMACQIDRAAGILPPPLDAALGWVVREGVTNVVRHSRARHCLIRISRVDGTIRAEVTDDGRGAAATGTGSGLAGLAERVAGSGGQVTAGPLEAGGFRLCAALPLGAAAGAGGEGGR
jgi:two-component system, NarL family, sensor histidine kinase DesK